MVRKRLREQLHALREELKRNSAVDDGVRDDLEGVMGDIHELLERDDPAQDPETHANLAERLRDNVDRWEHSHPVLAQSVRSLVETLNSVGI